VADQIKNIDRRIAGFEVINNAGFETENLFGRLINEDEIKRRLEFLSDRTLEVAREILSEQMRQEWSTQHFILILTGYYVYFRV